MITGVVTGPEARIRLKVHGPRRREQDVDAVIDTGVTSWLSLPAAAIAGLRLPWQGFIRGILADGSQCHFDVYKAKVVWDGQEKRVSVCEAGGTPLVGMALLSGYELKVQVRVRGKVTIKRLP